MSAASFISFFSPLNIAIYFIFYDLASRQTRSTEYHEVDAGVGIAEHGAQLEKSQLENLSAFSIATLRQQRTPTRTRTLHLALRKREKSRSIATEI